MIIGSLVLPSIGGGVCQTATTLFNDAFELGLPILERTNHNLYLSHYPLGRDATVSWGGPDFKFRNDLKHGLLIKTSYTDSTLTFTFYGTPEHRRVVAHDEPADELDGAGDELRRRPERAARLRQGRRRARARRASTSRSVARSTTADGKLLRSDTFQLALHPGQPDDGLRPRQDAARPVHRAALEHLSTTSEPEVGLRATARPLSPAPRAVTRSGARSSRARAAPPRPCRRSRAGARGRRPRSSRRRAARS